MIFVFLVIKDDFNDLLIIIQESMLDNSHMNFIYVQSQ